MEETGAYCSLADQKPHEQSLLAIDLIIREPGADVETA
jgi:hypothetical protein